MRRSYFRSRPQPCLEGLRLPDSARVPEREQAPRVTLLPAYNPYRSSRRKHPGVAEDGVRHTHFPHGLGSGWGVPYDAAMMPVAIIVGAAMLLFGRRLFWVFVAGAGFLFGA